LSAFLTLETITCTIGTMEQWIAHYGYLGILLGCFVEGETTILVGAIFAKFGFLSLTQVILCSFLGTFMGDCTFFFLGRYFGRSLLERSKLLSRRTDLARRIIHRYGNLIVAVMRLLAGFRAAILVLLGCSHFGSPRFLALDFLATAVWALGISLIGYSFANVVYIFVTDVKGYEGMIVPAVMVIAILAILFYKHVVKEKEEEEFYGD
jgi:membrane protein DedA with SNARE-associated domain